MGVFVAVLLVHDIFGTHGYLGDAAEAAEIQKISQELKS